MLGAGAFNLYRGLSRKFRKDLKEQQMGSEERRWYSALGVVGHIARGVVFVLAGLFLVRAAWEYDPKEAMGLDGALAKLAHAVVRDSCWGHGRAGLLAYGSSALSRPATARCSRRSGHVLAAPRGSARPLRSGMARSVIVSAARTPVREARRRPRRVPGAGARRDRDQGCAGAGRARAGGGRVRDHGRGAPGRSRPGARPPGCDRAGIPKEVGADTINKVCASSIRAVEIADSMIRAGDLDVIVTGGMESMSNAPYLLEKARFGYRLGDGTLIDSMVHDGLTSTFDERHMVEQASFVSRELGISREEQDRWALRSHERAVQAIDEGRFADEIVPVGELDTDEGPRRDTSLEKLASLKPVFDPEGTTTAGNAPGVNDGAGAVIVTSEEFARSAGSRSWRRSSRRATSPTTSRISRALPRRRGRSRSRRPGRRSTTSSESS